MNDVEKNPANFRGMPLHALTAEYKATLVHLHNLETIIKEEYLHAK